MTSAKRLVLGCVRHTQPKTSLTSNRDALPSPDLSLICLRTPTSSSSTLCCSPADVSMNLAPNEIARFLPSARKEKNQRSYNVWASHPVSNVLLQLYLWCQSGKMTNKRWCSHNRALQFTTLERSNRKLRGGMNAIRNGRVTRNVSYLNIPMRKVFPYSWGSWRR